MRLKTQHQWRFSKHIVISGLQDTLVTTDEQFRDILWFHYELLDIWILATISFIYVGYPSHDTPAGFCGLQNFTWLSIGRRMSGQWLNFHFWVNYPFKVWHPPVADKLPAVVKLVIEKNAFCDCPTCSLTSWRPTLRDLFKWTHSQQKCVTQQHINTHTHKHRCTKC